MLAEQLRRAVLSYYKYHTIKEEEIIFPGIKKIIIPVEKTGDVVYQCKNCLTVYDEQVGEPENGIDPGTPFKQLPNTFCCSVCDATKADFVAVKKEAIGL